MALTFAKLDPNPDHVSGNKRVRYRLVTFDNSYPTDGEAYTASDFGLTVLEVLEIVGGAAQKSDESLAVSVAVDHTAKKLVAYEGKADAADAHHIEEDDTASLDGYYVVCKAVGW